MIKIPDIAVTFNNNVVKIEFTEDDQSLQYAVDLSLVKHYNAVSTEGMNEHDTLATQICTAVTMTCIELKLITKEL